MVITPGTYLRKRREAARVTIAAIAANFGTEPRIGELDRADWLRQLEADTMRPDAFTIYVLHNFFAFDGEVLDQLIDLFHFGARLPAPQLCRGCACSWQDPCIDTHGEGCSWVERDLCSVCDTHQRSPRLALTPDGGAVLQVRAA